MVKPAFQRLKVDLWVHTRKLGVAQPSVCLFHARRDAGVPILEALAELSEESLPAQRTITFQPCSRPHGLRKLQWKLESVCDELKIMHISFDRDTAAIRMTEAGMVLLKNALATWFGGGEDFGVSPRNSGLTPKSLGKLDRESGELWFWGPGYAGP